MPLDYRGLTTVAPVSAMVPAQIGCEMSSFERVCFVTFMSSLIVLVVASVIFFMH
jgi:hypothetical protein